MPNFSADMVKPDHNGTLQLPAFNLVDASLTYNFNLKKVGKFTTRFAVNNLFDEIYISESRSNIFAKEGDKTWNGINIKNLVYFGWGRSWNFSIKYQF